MPDSKQIRSAVETYVRSFNEQDKQAFLGVFADGVQQIDPVGSAPNVGRQALSTFWDAVFGQWRKIDFRVKDLIVTGDEAALVFHITQSNGSAATEIDGIDVFQVDDTGRIALIKGYSDPDHVRSRD